MTEQPTTMHASPERTQDTLELTAEPSDGRWHLEVQDDDGVRIVPLTNEALVVGSARGADVLVRDPTVSGRHCSVAVVGGAVFVKDLASTNGTFVAGTRIAEGWAGLGSVITVGQSALVCTRDRRGEEVESAEPLPGIAGASEAMRRIASQVRRLACVRSPVLVMGETGVGKELVVRALHRHGGRRDAPFVALNVAALPRELVESELFGHERGAFTGAVKRRAGAFVEADGGTLFLDEIGELPIDAQPKLLRALDGYEVRSVGACGTAIKPNARVVAATHVPLLARVDTGTFRRDLYHRLEVFVIEVPPLRERPGDILPIARSLLAQMEGEIGRRELTPAASAALVAYNWPGNVRELRNALNRAAHLSRGVYLDAAAVERGIQRRRPTPAAAHVPVGRPTKLTADRARELLRGHSGNISAAARAAGVSRTTFRKVMRR